MLSRTANIFPETYAVSLFSESSFSDASGRLIIIDEFSNIVWTYGSGFFNIINDAKVLKDDHIMVSL